MKNILKYSLVVAAAVAVFGVVIPSQAEAAHKTARTSASMSAVQEVEIKVSKQDNRAEILKTYLEKYIHRLLNMLKHSLMKLIKTTLTGNWLRPLLVTNHTSVNMIPPYSYNGWGYGVYGNNVRRFTFMG